MRAAQSNGDMEGASGVFVPIPGSFSSESRGGLSMVLVDGQVEDEMLK